MKTKLPGMLAIFLGVFLCAGVAAASDVATLQPASDIVYDEQLIVNDTAKFDSIYVGKQGVGGVTFFNGTIVNSTTGEGGSDNPVTIGDHLRIDGGIYNTEIGGDHALKIFDSMNPGLTKTNNLGTASLRWNNLYAVNGNYSGNIQGTNAAFSGGIKSKGAEFSGNVLPKLNNSNDLGSTAKRWNNVYAKNTNLSGNLMPASDATSNIGSPEKRWKSGYFSEQVKVGNSVVIDENSINTTGGPITIVNPDVNPDKVALKVYSIHATSYINVDNELRTTILKADGIGSKSSDKLMINAYNTELKGNIRFTPDPGWLFPACDSTRYGTVKYSSDASNGKIPNKLYVCDNTGWTLLN